MDMDAVEDVQETALTLRLWNALPVSGTVRLIAAMDSLTAAGHTETAAETLCTVTLPPARIVNGRVAGASNAVTEVVPPAVFYEMLANPPFYLRADLTLDGTEGDTLAAYGSDYVKFSATARVRYRISSEH